MKRLLLLIFAICSTNGLDLGIYVDIFDILTGIPPLLFPPTEVTENDVSFYLSTRTQPQPQLLTKENLTAVDTSKNFKYIVHGWLETYDVQHYIYMKDEYLIKGDYNVILVNWSGPAGQRYTQSVQNTKEVAKIIANHIIFLDIPMGNIHLVGHSLGGQTVGYVGKNIQKLTGKKLRRVTGLDPAGPNFAFTPSSKHIFETDAEFVDIVHTDGGVFGYYFKTGKVDFNPNGGTSLQKGCPKLPTLSSPLDIEALGTGVVFCSHQKSCTFFAESINNSIKKSQKCLNYAEFVLGLCPSTTQATFGENVELTAPNGNYYLYFG